MRATERSENIESAISDEITSGHYSCEATPFRSGDLTHKAEEIGFIQGDIDVHGSHELFYWTRSRGRGIIIGSNSAALVAHYSADMGRIVLIRPVGTLHAITKLIEEVFTAIAVCCDQQEVVVRYCSLELANELRKLGATYLSRPLLDSAFADDETWPEVIINGEIDYLPRGQVHLPVRKAIRRYENSHKYYAGKQWLDRRATRFIQESTSRTGVSDDYENGFNEALISFLNENEASGLTYHYLFADAEIEGFAATGNNTQMSHCYYSGVRKRPRLSTYFLWNIFQNERANGAGGLNLGGSEQESLFRYKTDTFHNHTIQVTNSVTSRIR